MKSQRLSRTQGCIATKNVLLESTLSASEVCQHKIASALVGIEDATNFSDTIVVHAADKETHDKRLREVLERMEAVNLTLNWEK